ncbi:MAG: hypothetical protein WCS92_02885 [Candidatus Babeliales bacterium]|jgi:hypothetical protein|nr:MAG: hypothetical protein US22_C0064G0003 [candidate division TM6 bacterium GW2011_GWF2_36_6]
MKKNSFHLLLVLFGLILTEFPCLAANEINMSGFGEQHSTTQSKHVKFDKKKYNELVKKILRTKTPSFLSSAANKSFKEFLYMTGSVLVGMGTFNTVETNGNSDNKWAACLFSVVLVHTFMQLLFDYLLASKDQNLKNLEDFELYIQQTFALNEDLIEKNSDFILKLFEKDYDLISNKLDHDGEAGVIRKISRFLFKESVFLLESGIFGAAVAAYTSDGGALVTASAAGISYFILLTLIFDVLLAKKDQRVLKVEKFRDIDQFFEEIKIKKLELQHEHIALVAE